LVGQRAVCLELRIHALHFLARFSEALIGQLAVFLEGYAVLTELFRGAAHLLSQLPYRAFERFQPLDHHALLSAGGLSSTMLSSSEDSA